MIVGEKQTRAKSLSEIAAISTMITAVLEDIILPHRDYFQSARHIFEYSGTFAADFRESF